MSEEPTLTDESNINNNNITINNNISNNSSNTKTFIILGIIVLLIIAGFAFYKTSMTGNTITGNTATIIDNKNTDNTMAKSTETTKILMKTSEGDIELELYPKLAPITVKNFLSYVNKGTYENTVFHRVISGFMIQGGGFTEDGKEKPTDPAIKIESDNGLKNDIGTIAMARTSDPNSATDQFFINTKDNTFLNKPTSQDGYGYTVFGKVTKGMDVVKKIEGVKTTTKYSYMEDWPVKDVVIQKVEVIQ